ncbi:MAG: PASTA domain-containing protein [Candidatus Cryptobacteroides sp.]
MADDKSNLNSENTENKKCLTDNIYIKNILGIFIALLALVISSSIFLKVITHHGNKIEVPDFTNMTMSEAKYNAGINNIRVLVIDSVYVRRMKKGAVYSQTPKPGSTVKKGRLIRLTINSITPKKIIMPNLVGVSMRQAHAELLSRGLNLGQLIYVNDIATNNVIRQLYNNKEIKPGMYINSGSNIDLVVGLNNFDNTTNVPDVIGMKYMRAVSAVHDYSLNVSRLVFDSSVRNYADSLDAVVYKQGPVASEIPVIMGSDVSLYLTVDAAKIPNATK